MEKFDFNKTYKLTEAFDFGTELENIDSNSLGDAFILLLYGDIRHIQNLSEIALNRFTELCLTLVDTPEKMKKALIDFGKFFMCTPDGNLRKLNPNKNHPYSITSEELIFLDYDSINKKDTVCFYCNIDINQFIKLKNILNPTPLNCSKEAMALALLLCDDMLYCDSNSSLLLNFVGDIDWEYEPYERETGCGGEIHITDSMFNELNVVSTINNYELLFEYNFYIDKVSNKDLYEIYIDYFNLYVDENIENISDKYRTGYW